MHTIVAHSGVAAAQQLMTSRIEHVCQPQAEAVAHFERLYQRYLNWSAQAEPLHAPAQQES